MRIFLSYGHEPAHAPTFARIRQAIEAAGHEIWKDSEQIKPGDDWRDRIETALLECDWLIAALGGVHFSQRDLLSALAAYRASTAIRERLAIADPANTERQHDLAVSHTKIGDVLQAHGDLQAALAAYHTARTICERLAATDPVNTVWQRELSISHDRIGAALATQGDIPSAVTAHDAALAIRERLAAIDRSNAEAQRDLIASLWRLVALYLATGDHAQACPLARRLHDEADRLYTDFPQDPLREDCLREATTLLAQACPS